MESVLDVRPRADGEKSFITEELDKTLEARSNRKECIDNGKLT